VLTTFKYFIDWLETAIKASVKICIELLVFKGRGLTLPDLERMFQTIV
jgi:hypothetical protein